VPHLGVTEEGQDRTRVRRVIVAGLAVVLGVGIWVAVDELSGPPTVDVVGDSITALSAPSIDASLTQSGYQPTIEAVPGIRLAQAEQTIDRLAQQPPDAWIIELGTNDAGGHNTLWPEAFLAEWQKVRNAACVIYVSVSPHAGPIADQIDASLAGLARAHANVHVLDWGHLADRNSAWLEPDTIHPTAAGQAELAALESQTLQQDC
jgi:lysophospholipase L1-like esterase